MPAGYFEVMESSAFNNGPLPYVPFESIVGDKVLVLPDKLPELTSGGIIIPDGVKIKGDRECWYGRVVKFGPGMPTWSKDWAWNDNRWPMPALKIGERVAYNSYGVTTVTVHDKEGNRIKLVSMHEDNVLAVIEDDDAVAAS